MVVKKTTYSQMIDKNKDSSSVILKKYFKRLRNDPREERDILDVIMENTEAHLAYLDYNFNIIKVNSAYLKASGYKKKDLIGENHFFLFPNEENEKIFDKVRRTGKTVKYKAKPFIYENQPGKGVTYWDWTLTPVKDSYKKVKGFVLSLVDVTQRIKSEEELKKVNSLFTIQAKVIDNSPDLIAVVDRKYIYQMVNPMYARMHKRSPDKIIGCRVSDILGKKVFINSIKPYLDRSLNGELVSFEKWFDYPDRKSRYMSVNYYPLEKNKFVVALINDATELKISEQIFKELNSKIINILESVTDAFFALDNRWRFIYSNKQTEEIFNKSREDLLGKNIWKVFPKALGSTFHKKSYEAVKSGASFAFEQYYRPKDKWFNVRVYPSKDGLSCYFHDITEQKELENRKDEFLSIASHEFKIPLTTIKAYTQILKNRLRKDSNETYNYALRIEDQTNRLVRIVEELLDVSRIESGKMEIIKEEFDIDSLVKETVEDVQNTTTHKIIIKKSTGKTVYADRQHIGRVLINLLSNAIKYSPGKDKIEVILSEDGKNVILAVKDYGIGISQENQNKVFERFFRSNNSSKGKFPGLGLGLYISMNIIKNCGGDMWLKSKEDKGSTFYFSLPIKKSLSKRKDRVLKNKEKDEESAEITPVLLQKQRLSLRS